MKCKFCGGKIRYINYSVELKKLRNTLVIDFCSFECKERYFHPEKYIVPKSIKTIGGYKL